MVENSVSVFITCAEKTHNVINLCKISVVSFFEEYSLTAVEMKTNTKKRVIEHLGLIFFWFKSYERGLIQRFTCQHEYYVRYLGYFWYMAIMAHFRWLAIVITSVVML